MAQNRKCVQQRGRESGAVLGFVFTEFCSRDSVHCTGVPIPAGAVASPLKELSIVTLGSTRPLLHFSSPNTNL